MEVIVTSSLPHRSVLIAVLILLAAGCVASPRNGEKLPSRGGPIRLTGVTSQPNSFVDMRAKNQRTGAWVSLSQGATSSSTATTDAAGTKWYAYNEPRALTNGIDYWKRASTVSGQRRVAADLRFYNQVDGDLHTFDMNADACGEQYRSQGLFWVINNCQSSNSPTATVYADCGKANQDCCIANDIAAANRCDDGRLCGSTNKCTVASGGLGQPCDGDGGCSGGSNLTCVANVCRDGTIENLPLATLDLRVTTCDDSSWNLQNHSSTLTVNVGTNDMLIEVPGTELRNNTVDTFGLSPMDVTRLRHITQLELEVYNRDWCISKVELIANGTDVVYSKSYSSPQYLLATYPRRMHDWLRISRDELRTYWTTRNPAGYCDAPTSMSGLAIERKIAGMLGDILVNSDDFKGDFDQGGFVRLRRVNDTTAKLSMRAHVERFVNGIGNVGADVEMSFTLGFTCGASGMAVTMSRVNVDDLDGNFVYDVLNIATAGFVEAAGTAVAEYLVNDATGSVREALDALRTDLPICPPLALDTAAPPNLNITIPIDPSLINICL